MTNALLERLDQLIASSSPSPLDQELRAFLELKLQARSGRAEGAREVNARRSEAADVVRGQIRAVVGALKLSRPLKELADAVRTRLRAKNQTAGPWQIRDELRELRKEAAAAEPKRTFHCTTLPSTKSNVGEKTWRTRKRATARRQRSASSHR